MSTKVCLIARGFEEKEDQIITLDSPTCLQESIRLLFSVAVSNALNVASTHIKCAFLEGCNIERHIYKATTER